MISKFNRIVKNSSWLFISNLINSISKIIVVPLLLSYYGKLEYGIIVLALSLNSYLNITNLGIPQGLVKFVSSNIAKNNIQTVVNLTNTSFSLFSIIGVLNALIFFGFAIFGISFFKVDAVVIYEFRIVLVLSGISVLISWPFSILDQLLNSLEDIAWLSKLKIISYVLQIIVTILSIWLEVNIVYYFVLYLLSRNIIIPNKLLRWYKISGVNYRIKFAWVWEDFREVFFYGMGILMIGISQSIAFGLRPIVLAFRESSGLNVLADYQIIFTIASGVTLFNGVILTTLLPASAKAYATNDDGSLNKIMDGATRYSWFFISYIIAVIYLNSEIIINLYVGKEYLHLVPALRIWLLSFGFLYLSAVASIVLASGRIKLLTITSPINAIISLTILWILAPKYGVEAAAISTLAYYLLQFIVYHIYYLPKILKINSLKYLTQKFAPPVFAATIMVFLPAIVLNLTNDFSLQVMILKTIIGTILFVLLNLIYYIKPFELKKIIFAIVGKI
ncbi:MAG: polysaccharide biosynthesis C-terminal domain-containing protein [Saprospiraceae bacterium]|nr:polysaccharide biosynthesis C-terminal domain-containing protein [Saprospiraceae bacterium]